MGDDQGWDAAEIVSPRHYLGKGGLEAKAVIREFSLGFWAGNAVKYVLRHQRKGHPLTDLRKARECLSEAIRDLEEDLNAAASK